MLAEDIGGWLFALLVMAGGLVASVVALIALVPAFRGHWQLAIALSVPAVAVGLLVAAWMVYSFFSSGSMRDPEADVVHDFFMPWAVMGGPALVTGMLGMTVAMVKRKREG